MQRADFELDTWPGDEASSALLKFKVDTVRKPSCLQTPRKMPCIDVEDRDTQLDETSFYVLVTVFLWLLAQPRTSFRSFLPRGLGGGVGATTE